MEPFCSIDERFRDQVSTLLQTPPDREVQEYFDKLIASRQCRGIRVVTNGEHGKGVFAEVDFEEGELVLKDQMLAGAQHSSNKMDCLVCSFCFRFIGSIELQIGRKLYFQDLGACSSTEHENQKTSNVQEDCSHSGSFPRKYATASQDRQDGGQCFSSSSNKDIILPNDAIKSLMNGDIQLPHSNQFPLPPVFSCLGGCKEAYYCSKLCAESDWELFHSLLCTGEGSKSLDRQALLKFIQHSNETNDIFILAAKVISSTILRYRKLKAVSVEELGKHESPSSSGEVDFALLLEAWKPVSMGYKRRWWDCIALPDDIDRSEEAAFRMQIKELAFTSLQLLMEAIYDKECEPLFSLEIYGHIIGMFELNNLDLVVESPVEDYFLYIDELPISEKKQAELITQPILDALGDEYSDCCEGTAFFPLQSCMNHSCQPNAKAFKREEDKDGQATIVALHPIRRGEEICISYIDEDLPFEDRQTLLADYGFRCICPKCLDEELQSKSKF